MNFAPACETAFTMRIDTHWFIHAGKFSWNSRTNLERDESKSKTYSRHTPIGCIIFFTPRSYAIGTDPGDFTSLLKILLRPRGIPVVLVKLHVVLVDIGGF